MRLPLPTALGLKALAFYFVLLGAFFAAPYANLFFLLITFLTVLGVLNLLWVLRNLSGVAAEIDEIEPVPAGAGAELRARIEAGRRTRFGLTLSLALEGEGRIEVPVAPLRGSAEPAGRVPGLPRGVHPVSGGEISSSWPLGLLRARRAVSAPSEIVVYPEPADLEEVSGGPGALSEICGGLAPSDGWLQPSGLREYRSGDELRAVHWKASARKGALVVKEWDGGCGSGVEVVLDRRAAPVALEGALSFLAALTLAAREQKELLTLHSQGLSRTFGSGRRPWREILRFLAGAESLPATAAAPPPASPGVLRLPAAGGGVP